MMSIQKKYATGNMVNLLQTDAVTSFTRNVLISRLDKTEAIPEFFNLEEFALLKKLCNCLMAQEDGQCPYNPAEDIDKRLASGKTDGWRYDKMPDDKMLYKQGFYCLNKEAIELFSTSFVELQQNELQQLLENVQRGRINKTRWAQIDPQLFFEEILAETTALFYSHPLVLESIGFTGMADANGWMNIGLNEKDAKEQTEII